MVACSTQKSWPGICRKNLIGFDVRGIVTVCLLSSRLLWQHATVEPMWDPYSNNILVSGGSTGESGHGPIQFGYRLWLPSNEEINVRYWETYEIASIAESRHLDAPLIMVPVQLDRTGPKTPILLSASYIGSNIIFVWSMRSTMSSWSRHSGVAFMWRR